MFSEDFERVFSSIFRMIDDIENAIERRIRRIGRAASTALKRPYIYGLSIAFTPEGYPVIRRFGNVKLPVSEPNVRTPYYETSVDEKEGVLTVLVEMPGVSKEEIKLSSTENLLSISADGRIRRYSVDIDLPYDIDPSTAKASYSNGILEVKFKLKSIPKPKGFEIKID